MLQLILADTVRVPAQKVCIHKGNQSKISTTVYNWYFVIHECTRGVICTQMLYKTLCQWARIDTKRKQLNTLYTNII